MAKHLDYLVVDPTTAEGTKRIEKARRICGGVRFTLRCQQTVVSSYKKGGKTIRRERVNTIEKEVTMVIRDVEGWKKRLEEAGWEVISEVYIPSDSLGSGMG